jgi:hypothetical protein
MKSQLKVVAATQPAEKDNLFELIDFPSVKLLDDDGNPMVRTMDIEHFIKMSPFPANRDVEARAKKAVIRLTTPMHKHNEVDILYYTGPTVTEPAFFKHNTYYVLDGNTRKYIWESYLTGTCVHPKVTKIKIPNTLVYNRYDVNDADEAIALYYTIDSAEAYEKKPEKVTGAFRAQNLLGNFTNKKMKSGAIATAMNSACPLVTTKGVFGVAEDLFDQTTMLRNVLIDIDKLDAPGKGVLSTQLSLGVAMAAGVVMDTNNRWANAVERLINPEVAKDILIDDDGIFWVSEGNERNVLEGEINNALPYNTGLFNNRKACLDYIAYCWMQYIDNIPMYDPPTAKQISNAYDKLLHRAWVTDSEEI